MNSACRAAAAAAGAQRSTMCFKFGALESLYGEVRLKRVIIRKRLSVSEIEHRAHETKGEGKKKHQSVFSLGNH